MPTSPATDAVLLVNLGTPDAPTAAAVSRYLREFLSDRRVVALPPLLWQPLLRGVILPRRSPKVARKYAGIWMEGGSPLAVHTRALAVALEAEMPGLRVLHAMRYGNPSLHDAFAELRAAQVARVLVLPLYPQYSTTTTETVVDVVTRQTGPRARVVHDYHDDAGWVAAVAASVRAHWDAHGRGDRLVFSFHGLPKRVIANGDPYAAQSQASVALIARALGLAEPEYVLSYQSRFGAERWLEPSTADTLAALARDGVRRVDVVCPGFAVDCLETLEEVAQENAEVFRGAGGQDLRYIPCLNAAPGHARALAALARRELAAW